MPDEIKVIMAGPQPTVVSGSTGLMTQLPGGCITADAIGCDIGGRKKNLAQVAIDGSGSKDKTKHNK